MEDFFTKEELGACRDAVSGQVDRLAEKLYKAGKIKSTKCDLSHLCVIRMFYNKCFRLFPPRYFYVAYILSFCCFLWSEILFYLI